MTATTIAVLTTKPKIIATGGPKGTQELNGHPVRSLKVGKSTKFGVAVKGDLHEIRAVGPMIVTVDLTAKPLVKGRAEYREASKACTKADLGKIVKATKAPKVEADDEAVTFTAKPEKAKPSKADANLAKRLDAMEKLIAKQSAVIESLIAGLHES
jgi:hypothetical protein